MSEKVKIGTGHASAMARLGLRELRNAATVSRDGIADSEMGLYGTRTPGEVAEIRQGESHRAEQSPDRHSGMELER